MVAHTVNGAIVAILTRVAPDKPMAFTSLSGPVDVTLPAATKATVELRSDNGDVFTDFTLGPPPPPASDPRKPGGSTRVVVTKVTGGTLNGGGSKIELRTFSDNVYLRKAK